MRRSTRRAPGGNRHYRQNYTGRSPDEVAERLITVGKLVGADRYAM
jgi:hypothetical protein